MHIEIFASFVFGLLLLHTIYNKSISVSCRRHATTRVAIVSKFDSDKAKLAFAEVHRPLEDLDVNYGGPPSEVEIALANINKRKTEAYEKQARDQASRAKGLCKKVDKVSGKLASAEDVCHLQELDADVDGLPSEDETAMANSSKRKAHADDKKRKPHRVATKVNRKEIERKACRKNNKNMSKLIVGSEGAARKK